LPRISLQNKRFSLFSPGPKSMQVGANQSLPKHRELRLRQVRNALFRRRPWKVSALKNLVK
jgi:hypothetical protein